MLHRLAAIPAIALVALIFAGLVRDYSEQAALRPLAEAFMRSVPQDLGAPNVVTGILLTFRAFDTLGEVAVLFMVAAGVGLLLSGDKSSDADSAERKPASELVQNGADVLLPLIFIFSAYIIMNGHLHLTLGATIANSLDKPAAAGGLAVGDLSASAALIVVIAVCILVIPQRPGRHPGAYSSSP